MSLFVNMLSRFVIAFLLRNKRLLVLPDPSGINSSLSVFSSFPQGAQGEGQCEVGKDSTFFCLRSSLPRPTLWSFLPGGYPTYWDRCISKEFIISLDFSSFFRVPQTCLAGLSKISPYPQPVVLSVGYQDTFQDLRDFQAVFHPPQNSFQSLYVVFWVRLCSSSYFFFSDYFFQTIC